MVGNQALQTSFLALCMLSLCVLFLHPGTDLFHVQHDVTRSQMLPNITLLYTNTSYKRSSHEHGWHESITEVVTGTDSDVTTSVLGTVRDTHEETPGNEWDIFGDAVRREEFVEDAAMPQQPCPDVPHLHALVTHTEYNTTWQNIQEELAMVSPGGAWTPPYCRPAQSLALIIPYRDRESNLKTFVHNIHQFLQHQLANYVIYVVEQTGSELFNRGALMNAGFLFATAMGSHDCYVTHDVDMLPLSELNMYRCGPQPIHLTVNIEQFNYKLPYPEYGGGAIAFSRRHYLAINGYSNLYFGWGGEDDDLWTRLKVAGLQLQRADRRVALYASLTSGHHRENESTERFSLLANTMERYHTEGVSSLRFTLVKHQVAPLFTRVVVRLHHKAMERDYYLWRGATADHG